MRHYDYPEDEFDATDEDGPVPVGAHRADVPAWRSWVPLLLVLILVPILAWGTVTFLGRSRGSDTAQTTAPSAAAGAGTSSAAAQTTAPSQEGTGANAPTDGASASATPANVDFTLGVTVHNGTNTNGLAGRTGDRLRNAGFTAVTVSPGAYQAVEPQVSTVFYATAEEESTAQAVADALGITQIVESAADAESNPIVVVLRNDFQE